MPSQRDGGARSHFTDVGGRAAIVDLSGRTLLTHDFTGATTTIDISALPAGRYFVTLTSADGRHGRQVLVKN